MESNHALHIQTLRKMTPTEKVDKMFELSASARDQYIAGLRERFPNFTDEEIKMIWLARQVTKSQMELRVHSRSQSGSQS